MIHAILACDSQGGIARNGVMPWPHNKEDLQHFKKLTSHACVVMGRGTWEAPDMPTPLPHRQNYVVTSNPNLKLSGANIISHDVINNLTFLAKTNKVFVIGGAKLFTDVIDQIGIFHLTRISGDYNCDTFLPLDLINQKFELIDAIQIDGSTVFETYIARKAYDIYSRSNIR